MKVNVLIDARLEELEIRGRVERIYTVALGESAGRFSVREMGRVFLSLHPWWQSPNIWWKQMNNNNRDKNMQQKSKGINLWAASILRYSGHFLSRTRKILRTLNRKMRKLIATHMLHQRDDTDWLYLKEIVEEAEVVSLLQSGYLESTKEGLKKNCLQQLKSTWKQTEEWMEAQESEKLEF